MAVHLLAGRPSQPLPLYFRLGMSSGFTYTLDYSQSTYALCPLRRRHDLVSQPSPPHFSLGMSSGSTYVYLNMFTIHSRCTKRSRELVLNECAKIQQTTGNLFLSETILFNLSAIMNFGNRSEFKITPFFEGLQPPHDENFAANFEMTNRKRLKKIFTTDLAFSKFVRAKWKRERKLFFWKRVERHRVYAENTRKIILKEIRWEKEWATLFFYATSEKLFSKENFRWLDFAFHERRARISQLKYYYWRITISELKARFICVKFFLDGKLFRCTN